MSEFSDAGGPRIFVVATPIGNLGELSPRAAKVLAAVDLIAAEDTRVAKKLLQHIGVQRKEIISYQDHGEAERAETLLDRIARDRSTLALISDAGTPCVSDPGYRIVAAARERGIPVHPVSGPSAVSAIVSVAGLPTHRFTFVGFLPPKASAQRAEIESWQASGGSIVFFESTRRLAKTLGLIAEVYPLARVAVGRELTKLHEEIVVLPAAAAKEWAASHSILRGEAVVMVHPGEGPKDLDLPLSSQSHQQLVESARVDFRRGATLKDLLQKYAAVGLARKDLYQLLLTAKEREQ